MENLNAKRTLLLMSICVKIKKSSRYVLPTLPFQGITWIYYISLLRKHLIAYCRETWADSYGDNIIITTTKNSSTNIVYVVVPMKRYWKKTSLQKQNTNYIDLLSSTWISKAFYLNKTCLSHRHRNPSLPITSITYHVRAAFSWNAMMDNTLNHLR